MKLFKHESYEKYVDSQKEGVYNHPVVPDSVNYEWINYSEVLFLKDNIIDPYFNSLNIIPKHGICHGAKLGKENLWFEKETGVDFIGTDISIGDNKETKLIQWDFHNVKKEWENKFDIIYSNALDHSYDPSYALKQWASCLSQHGICILEWTTNDSEDYVSHIDTFGASIEEYKSIINSINGKVIYELNFQSQTGNNIGKTFIVWNMSDFKSSNIKMTNLVTGLLEKHEKELSEIFLYSNFLNMYQGCFKLADKIGTHNDGSTYLEDCKFLQLLCLEKCPKKILEVGTWVGSTAYSMAFATKKFDTIIYTCDNQNAFLYSGEIEAQRIRVFPNTWSSQLLDYGILDGIDLVFNDAVLSREDCEKIYRLSVNEFCFVTHDYYDKAGYPKGAWAISTMIEVLKENQAKYELYIPEEEWYLNPSINGNNKGINRCCAVLMCRKL